MSELPKVNSKRIVWLDLETTNFFPKGSILEIGIVVTDERFREIASWTSLVVPARDWKSELDQVTLRMHTDNSLLHDLAYREDEHKFLHPELVAAAAVRFLTRHGALNAPLGGSSVHFDRTFLIRDMPELAQALHYRQVDASGLRIGAQALGAVVDPPTGDSNHRALDDCYRSIALVKESMRYGRGWRAVWLHAVAICSLLAAMVRRG